MSIPNMITLVRIVLTPIFVRLYLEGEHTAAMLLLVIAMLSDLLDGFIARNYNMITPLGKVLDPVADKLLQLAMLLCLTERSAGVLPLLLLHLMRETGLFIMGGLAYRRTGRLIGAKWYGKACSAVMYGVLGAALYWQDMPETLLEQGILLCAVLVGYCIFRYAGEYMRVMKNPGEKNIPPYNGGI